MWKLRFVRSGLTLALLGSLGLATAQSPEGCIDGPFGDPAEPGPVVTELCAFTDGDNITIEWAFSESVDPFGGAGANPTGFAGEIDVDPATGEPGGIELGNCEGVDSGNFAGDAGFFMPDDFATETGTFPVLGLDSDGNPIELGEIEVFYGDQTISADLDAAMVGSSDGIVNLITVVQNQAGLQAGDEPVCAPDSSILTSAPAGEPPPRPDGAVSVPVATTPGLVIFMLLIAGLAVWRIRA